MSNTQRNIFLLIGAIWLGQIHLDAQQISWRQYTTSNSSLPASTVPSIETDHQGRKWIGTAHGGLAVLSNDNWTVYNTANSDIPDNYINAIAFAQDDAAWIGTGGSGSYGLARFDGTTWTSYNSGNSPIPVGNTQAVAIDGGGHIWIGSMFCSGGALISIQGSNWIKYDLSNSELPEMWIRDIETAGDEVWVASYDTGVAHFNGQVWTTYHTGNSGIPTNNIKDLAIGNDGIVWLATQAGLVSFDGMQWTLINALEANVVEVAPNGDVWVGYDGDGLARLHEGNWTTFTTHTSLLAEDFILSIEADDFGEVWVGTITQGITVLTVEGTAVASGTSQLASASIRMFPQPASETLTVNISEASDLVLQIFDLTGRVQLTTELTDAFTVVDISSLPSGHYGYSVSGMDGSTYAGMIAVN